MTNWVVQTPRLELRAASADLLAAELQGREALGKALSARVPSSWPPPLYERSHLQWTLAQLQGQPALCGWLAWLWLWKPEPSPLLVGLGGFKGKPNEFGFVEIGYTVLPEFQGRGLATEAVHALVNWAFGHPEVTAVFAETLPQLPASIRVLEKCGFEFVGNGSDIEVLRFQRKRSGT